MTWGGENDMNVNWIMFVVVVCVCVWGGCLISMQFKANAKQGFELLSL